MVLTGLPGPSPAGLVDVERDEAGRPRGWSPVGTGSADVILRAAAALPSDDRDRAVEQLRRQLDVMATAAGGTADWTTLDVAGPVEMLGASATTRFEWTASVAVSGADVLDSPADPGGIPSSPGAPA